MKTTLLQDLGLSLNEAKIYEALLRYGGSGVSTIALRSKVHRRNVYDSLQRLVEKGLVYETFGGKETVFEAVDPGKLMEFVKEKEAHLQEAMPELLSIFRKHETSQQAYIFKGTEGMKNFLRQALRQGEDVYCFAAKGGWFDPRLKTFMDRFLVEARRKGMVLHHLFDHDVREKFPDLVRTVGMPYKFLPKNYSTDSAVDVCGDYVVTFTGLGLAKLDDDVTMFVVVSPRLAESHRRWFRLVWDLLPDESNKKRRN